MPDALAYIAEKYGVNTAPHAQNRGVEIPNATRKDLARLFCLLQYDKGVEVGVESGAYTEVLAAENPGVRLWGVDAWRPYSGYQDHTRREKLERFYAEAQARLAPYAGVTLVRGFSVDAAKDFADGALDFVYIDASHRLEHVVADLAAWARKVRPGGIVAGHDYIRRPRDIVHVPQAIQAWTDAYDIAPWFLLGRKDDPVGDGRDRERSWFWVQP